MSTRVKGAVLNSRVAFVKSEFGDATWDRVLESLCDESRSVLGRSMLSSGWYPFKINDELDAAIVKIAGRGNREIFKKIGAKSATENLTGPHKAFLAKGRPDVFMSKTAAIYEFYYDVGSRTFEATESGADGVTTAGLMTTINAETFSQNDCLTVIGWYEEALKMCGAVSVDMREKACRAKGGPHCQYLVSWKT